MPSSSSALPAARPRGALAGLPWLHLRGKCPPRPRGGFLLGVLKRYAGFRATTRLSARAASEQQQTTAHDQRDIEPGERQQATLVRLAGFGGGSAATAPALAPSAARQLRHHWADRPVQPDPRPRPLAAVAGTRGLGERGRRQSENSGNGCKDADPL